MKNKQLILRALISIALLGFITARLDLGEVREVLGNFNRLLYAAGFGLLLISQFLHAHLLKTLSGGHGSAPSAAALFRALALSNFLGIFLPGSGGPDIMLGYQLSKGKTEKEKPLSAVIFARLLILFAALLTALVLVLAAARHMTGIRNAFAAAVFILLFAAFATLNGRCAAFSQKVLAFLKKNRWTHLLYKTYFVISQYRERKQLLFKAVPLALLVSGFRIAIDYAVARSLGIDVPVHYFYIFVPLISIATLIPVSFLGLGVREASYAGLFAAVGVSEPAAVSISLLAFSTGIIFALLGAFFYIRGGMGLPTGEAADGNA